MSVTTPEIQEIPIDQLMDFFEKNEVVGQQIEEFESYIQVDDQPPRRQQGTTITIQTQDGKIYQARASRHRPEPGRLEPVSPSSGKLIWNSLM